MLRVRVLFFGILRERIGVAEESIEIESGATVADLAALLSERHGDLARGVDKIRVAVNLEYVDSDHVLSTNDEIAVIPPVSGG